MPTLSRYSSISFILIAVSVAIFLVNGMSIQFVIDNYINPRKFGGSDVFQRFVLEKNGVLQSRGFLLSCLVAGILASAIIHCRFTSIVKYLASILAVALTLSIYDAVLQEKIDASWMLTFTLYNLIGSATVVSIIVLSLAAGNDVFDTVGRPFLVLAVSIVSWVIISAAIMFWIDPYPVSLRAELSGNVSGSVILDTDDPQARIVTEGADTFETSAGKVEWIVSANHPSALMDIDVYKASDCFPHNLNMKLSSAVPEIKLKGIRTFTVKSSSSSAYTAITAKQADYPGEGVSVELKALRVNAEGKSISQFVPEGQTTQFKSDDNFRLLFSAVALDDSEDEAISIAPPIISIDADGKVSNFSFPSRRKGEDVVVSCKFGRKSDPSSIIPGLLVVAKPVYSDDGLRVRYPFISELKTQGHFLQSIRLESNDSATMRREKASMFNVTYDTAKLIVNGEDFSSDGESGEVTIHGTLDVEWWNDKVKVYGVTRGISINGNVRRWTRWDLLTSTSQMAWLSALGVIGMALMRILYLLRSRITSGLRQM